MENRRIVIQQDIFSLNDTLADENFSFFVKNKIFSINVMASPGAGKTSLIEHTILELKGRLGITVIDGDIATTFDADRAASAGANAIQINTGGECHLDASMIKSVLHKVPVNETRLLIVENVGNLICPASFRLGVHKNILIASIPEGDDKPYKYPAMYRGVDVLIINKIDLLPYIPFRMEFFRTGIEILNPGLKTFTISCRTKEGITDWTSWLEDQVMGIR